MRGDISGKYSKVKILVSNVFKKVNFLRPFSTLSTDFCSIKIRVGYVYIEESFNSTFNMGNGSIKSPIGCRVN